MGFAYTYYPGCSLEATSYWYGRSIRAVAKALDIDLRELKDWNCCGATAYMSVRELMSFCISARNLAIAEPYERDLLTPCSACFTVLSKTNRYFKEMPEVREKLKRALGAAGLAYRGTVKVRHVLDAFVNDVGLEEIARRVAVPLGGLKVACYYGCQIVRPATGLDGADYPVILDRFFEAMGASPVPFSLKARCCGASLIVSREDVALDLIGDILRCAAQSGAEAIATVCPMCHINLETQMQRINAQTGSNFSMPIVYFTQLAGFALGADAGELGLEKGFQDPRPLLEQRTAAGARG